MSRKSGKSARLTPPRKAAGATETLDAKAKDIVLDYTLFLQPHDRLGFIGSAAELPTVFANGRTANKCIERVREALAVAVAVMLEQGQSPPAPASEKRRDMQVNIRLTAEEKFLLEQAARQRGFRGISNFLRSAALAETRRSA